MTIEIKIPSPGESITEVEIAAWLVKDGDFVEKDQIIAELDSDKASLELPAEESGIITLKAKEGALIAVGEIVCLIDTSQAKPTMLASKKSAVSKTDTSSEETKTVEIKEDATNKNTVKASPIAKKILDEKGIPYKKVQGSGTNGKITKEDAINALNSMGSAGSGFRGEERKKISMLRRKVAERLVAVKNQTAMLTTFNEVDMKAIFDLRKEYKEPFKEKHQVSLGFMSFFTLAVVRALKMFPEVNSMLNGDQKITYGFQDISIAVSGPKGLMVPVIRNAENLSFKGVEKEVKRLAIKAREGKITVDEMTGGTFTITNGGVFGSMLSTPIINPPQSGILGMHNIIERPVAIDSQVVIRPMMYVALSYDHRVIDGRESVGFLVAIKEAIENPISHLMDDNPMAALEL